MWLLSGADGRHRHRREFSPIFENCDIFCSYCSYCYWCYSCYFFLFCFLSFSSRFSFSSFWSSSSIVYSYFFLFFLFLISLLSRPPIRLLVLFFSCLSTSSFSSLSTPFCPSVLFSSSFSSYIAFTLPPLCLFPLIFLLLFSFILLPPSKIPYTHPLSLHPCVLFFSSFSFSFSNSP